MKKIILILLVLSLTGCWNYTELNNLAITTGFAVDFIDNEFEVTILISNSQKKTSTNSQTVASSAVYSGKGKTIFEAIKDTSMAVSKQIYLSHIEVLVLSEEVAKNKTKEVIDFFFRYPQTRNEFLMVIAENCNAKDTFEVTTPLETFPSQNISKNLEITNMLQGYIYTVTFNEFVRAIIEEGRNPVLPTISIIGNIEKGNKEENVEQNKPQTYLKLGMMAIFNGFDLIKISNKDQSKGINLIDDKIHTTLISNQYKDGYVIVELLDSKSDINVEIKDDMPKIKIKIKANGAIEEVSGNIDIEQIEEINNIREASEDEIVRIVNEAIAFSKEIKTDILGFGNLIYKKDYKFWKKIKEKWQSEMLSEIEVETKVTLDLKAKGKIDSVIEVN